MITDSPKRYFSAAQRRPGMATGNRLGIIKQGRPQERGICVSEAKDSFDR